MDIESMFGSAVEPLEKESERLMELHRKNVHDIRKFRNATADGLDADVADLLNKIENRSKAAITDVKETA